MYTICYKTVVNKYAVSPPFADLQVLLLVDIDDTDQSHVHQLQGFDQTEFWK